MTPSTKIVTLPDLPPKGDVTDWLTQGGTRPELEALVAQTPNWTPSRTEATSKPMTSASALAFMNERHAVVRDGGKTIVINEQHDAVLGRQLITRSSFADTRNFYGARKVQVGETKAGHPIVVPLGRFWLSDCDRRQFDGVVCAPGQNVPGHYNLWRGFAVEAKPGDWSLLRRHIYDNICGGDQDLHNYLMAFLAHGVQRPDERPEVAVVFRGGRGTGKGVVVNEYGRLFGQHFIHVSQARHLTGHFNAHLRDAVVVFADEAYFPGDKQSEGALKMVITEPTIPIERKGQDVVVVKNMIHLLLASNHNWVVPAGLDERRFVVCDVSDAHQQDHAYFQAIVEQMQAGGRAAMLHELLHHDASSIDLRQVPVTSALIEQKVLSMPPAERWWYQKLVTGQLLPEHDGWEREVLKAALHHDYIETLGKIGIKHKSTETELGMVLAKMLLSGGLDTTRKIVTVPFSLGRTDEGTAKRLAHWRVPTLSQCRADFDRISRTAHEWVTKPAQGDE